MSRWRIGKDKPAAVAPIPTSAPTAAPTGQVQLPSTAEINAMTAGNTGAKILNKISAAEVVAAKANRPKWRSGRNCETCGVEFAPFGGLLGVGTKDVELLAKANENPEATESMTAAKKGRLLFEHNKALPSASETLKKDKLASTANLEKSGDVKKIANMFGGAASALGKSFRGTPGKQPPPVNTSSAKSSQEDKQDKRGSSKNLHLRSPSNSERRGRSNSGASKPQSASPVLEDRNVEVIDEKGDPQEEKSLPGGTGKKRRVKKHHCRNCGGVFCARCAKHMIAVPSLGYLESVRVCNSCFPGVQTALQNWLSLNEQRNNKSVTQTVVAAAAAGVVGDQEEARLVAEQELRRAARRQHKKELAALKEMTNEFILINQEKSIFNTPDHPRGLKTPALAVNTREQDLKLLSKHGSTAIFAISAIDPLFTQVPKNEVGFRIWRIEFMEIEEWPKSKFGEFFKDDAYVILYSFIPENEHEAKTEQTISEVIEHHVYFWVGSQCCHDEKAVAAIKSTELCRHLDGAAVIHRESEGHESPAFLALFPMGISYLDGGIETGLNEVIQPPARPNRLFHIKGKQRVRINQVACEWTSLNSGDVFILETEYRIYNWYGKESNRFEQARSLQIAMSLREKRTKPVIIEALREGADDFFDSNPEFWSSLHATVDVSKHIKTSADGGQDENAELQTVLDLFEVYETGDDTDPFHFGLVDKPTPDLTRNMLDSSKMYILDCDTEIFIWIGKKTSKLTKHIGMKLAMQFLDYYDRPDWTPVTRMMESAEVPTFRAKFKDWDYEEIQRKLKDGSLKRTRSKSVDNRMSFDLNAFAMHAHQTKVNGVDDAMPVKPYDFSPGPNDGKMIIYEVKKTELEDVSSENFGFFSQKSSYVIVFTFKMVLPPKYEIPRDSSTAPNDLVNDQSLQKQSLQHWVFFWQGKECPKVSIITWKMELAADICSMLEETSGVKPVTFNIQQGREPDYFLDLFDKHVIVYRDRNPTIPSNEDVKEEMKPSTNSVQNLFHVKLSPRYQVAIALEVDCTAKSLNPGDAFVLVKEDKLIVWLGEWSDETESTTAVAVAERMKGDRSVLVIEGDGVSSKLVEYEFWDSLGGRLEDVCSEEYLKTVASDYYSVIPRLFQCTVADGKFRVTEFFNFHQEDLISDDVMMLDVKNEVYLWIGQTARKDEKEYALKLAQQYISLAPDGRLPDCPIIEVPEGQEPWIFTRHFHGWEHNKRGFLDPYQKNIQALESLGVMGRVVVNPSSPLEMETDSEVKAPSSSS